MSKLERPTNSWKNVIVEFPKERPSSVRIPKKPDLLNSIKKSVNHFICQMAVLTTIWFKKHGRIEQRSANCNHTAGFKIDVQITVNDVDFRSGNYLFTKCCPGIIKYSLNSCRLKTPQSPKRTQYAQAPDTDKLTRITKRRKNRPICEKDFILEPRLNSISFFRKSSWAGSTCFLFKNPLELSSCWAGSTRFWDGESAKNVLLTPPKSMKRATFARKLSWARAEQSRAEQAQLEKKGKKGMKSVVLLDVFFLDTFYVGGWRFLTHCVCASRGWGRPPYRPRPGHWWLHLPLHNTWKPMRVLKISVLQKRPMLVLQKPCLQFFWIWRLVTYKKSQKRHPKKRNYFPGHFHRLGQLLLRQGSSVPRTLVIIICNISTRRLIVEFRWVRKIHKLFLLSFFLWGRRPSLINGFWGTAAPKYKPFWGSSVENA